MLFLLLAAAAGVLMAVQGCINGALGKLIGVWEGNFIVHAVGLLLIAVFLFVLGLGKGDWHKLAQTPWYLYSGGLINVLIIFGVMVAIGALGAGDATCAIIAGQLTAALLLDAFGLFGLEKQSFTWLKGGGLLLMLLGARLMLK